MAKEGEGHYVEGHYVGGSHFGIRGGQSTANDLESLTGTPPTDWACPNVLIPAELWAKLDEYLGAGKHGNVTLNIKGGKIISWQLTEIGRIDKGCMPTVD